MDFLSSPVLILNRYYQPVRVTTARRAFILLYAGVAHAIDAAGELYDFSRWRNLSSRTAEPSVSPNGQDDESIPIVGGRLRIPRLLHLHRYERTPRTTVRLTRKNVMFRDAHQCQYCGKSPPVRDLNIDHVMPRSRGGADTWENLVTSCRPCNLRKGWKTPEEADMLLARRPFRPRWSISAQIILGAGKRYQEWDPFLGEVAVAV